MRQMTAQWHLANVIPLDELPRNANGKILNDELHKPLEGQKYG